MQDVATHTFLFSDLVGFTALTAERGDDHGAEVAIALRDRARGLLARLGGEEIKSLGDGVMLRLPSPQAAVALGLELAQADTVPVRVGIHTGPAVEREGDWYGTTVNVAARLCSAAGGGQVLVSETTLTAAGALPEVEVGERRLHWLKNLRDPVAAHLVEPLPATPLRERARRFARAVACGTVHPTTEAFA